MRVIRKFSVISSLFLFPLYALSLQDTQPYQISSNQSVLLRDQHKAIFTGHVQVNQGNRKMRGDKLVLLFDTNNKKILQLIDYGEPATYFFGNPVTLTSHAKIIHFYPEKNFVTFSKKATLIQKKNTISGDYITYDLKKQVITSNPTKKIGRTFITIQPQSIR